MRRLQYPSSLYAVVGDEGVPEPSRVLAAVNLKNCLSKFWRRQLGAGGLTDEDKARLREQFISNLNIANDKIAKQLSVVVAKIARSEWPDDWPALLPRLLQAVQTSDGLPRMRALMFLHCTIKELSARVVGPTRKHLANAAPPIFSFLFGLWNEARGHAISDLKAAEVERYCVKILRRLVCHAFSRIDLSADVAAFLEASLQVVQERTYSEAGSSIEDEEDKTSPAAVACGTAVKLALMFNEAQHAHPMGFGAYIQPFLSSALQMLESYGQLRSAHAAAGTSWQARRYQQRIVIRAILFVNNVLAAPQYRAGAKPRGGSSPDKDGEARAPLPTPDAIAARIKDILTPDAVSHLARITVTSLIPLEAADLEEWREDAEEFVHSEANEEGLRVRPSAETLYAQLMHYDADLVSRVTLELLQSVALPCDPTAAPQQVLLREALYNALGLCAYELQDVVDFPAWMQSHLAAEAAGHHPLQFVIRRRLALLVGHWGDTLRDPQHRAAAYRAVFVLMRDGDMAVRVSGCEGLLRLVDDVNFYAEHFEEHLVEAVSVLFDLLKQAQHVDSKLKCLNVLTLLMGAMAARIQPVVQGILQVVPDLWEQAKSEELMMGAVLVTLTRLVQAIGPSVASVQDFVVNVVTHAADVDSETELYTLEDGLDLWLSLARNLPHASPRLTALFPLLFKVLARDFEHLQVCMHIVESSLLLSGTEVVEVHGSPLAQMLLRVLGNVKESGTLVRHLPHASPLSSFLLPPAPSPPPTPPPSPLAAGVRPSSPGVPPNCFLTGLLQMAIEVLDLLLTVQPQRGVALLEGAGVVGKVVTMMLDSEEEVLVRAACVALLSRVATWDAAFFVALLERVSAAGVGAASGGGEGGGGGEALRHRFVDECIARADNLMLPRKRRLVALGVLNLIAVADTPTLRRAPAMLALVNEIIVHEFKDSQLPGRAADAPQDFSDAHSREAGVYDFTGLEAGEQEPETLRRRQIENEATMQDAHVASTVQVRLQQCAMLHGAQVFEQVLATVDPDVLQQLQHFASLPPPTTVQ
jgi:hypothetical protein